MKIVICNSVVFWKEALFAKNHFEQQGYEVETHPMEVEIEGKKIHVEEYYTMRKSTWNEEIEDRKYELMKKHFDLIKNCDRIVVLNLDKNGIKNYIGGNTFLEMGVAFALEKDIYLTNPIPENLSYTEEIKGMKPHVMNWNIERMIRNDS